MLVAFKKSPMGKNSIIATPIKEKIIRLTVCSNCYSIISSTKLCSIVASTAAAA